MLLQLGMSESTPTSEPSELELRSLLHFMYKVLQVGTYQPSVQPGPPLGAALELPSSSIASPTGVWILSWHYIKEEGTFIKHCTCLKLEHCVLALVETQRRRQQILVRGHSRSVRTYMLALQLCNKEPPAQHTRRDVLVMKREKQKHAENRKCIKHALTCKIPPTGMSTACCCVKMICVTVSVTICRNYG